MSNNDSLVYNDIVKPLKNYKNHVWYDDSKGIDEMANLAAILDLKSIAICGEKDAEEDIAKVYTNKNGDGLVIENCHLKIDIQDWYNAMSVKDKDGNKTIFRRGDKNGI